VPHVPEHEGCEHHKRRQREHDEGHDAGDDLTAGSIRRPGKLAERLSLIPGELQNTIGAGIDARVDAAQIAQSQPPADLLQSVIVDLMRDGPAGLHYCAHEQLLLVVGRHVVGALSRAEHRNDDEEDGDRDNNSERHHHAHWHAVALEGAEIAAA
jgi:hypothetical protein